MRSLSVKRSSRGWTSTEKRRLRSLASAGEYFYTEIARQMGKKEASVRWMAKKLGLRSSLDMPLVRARLGSWNKVHAHLQEPVLRYYFSHSAEETAKKFGLTKSEFKSCLTYAYKNKDIRHIRKDKRTHAPLTAKELKFLLQHSGLRPRAWVMRQMGRGTNVCHIKERLQRLGVASRTLQGLTLSQYRQAFNGEPSFFLQTDAGPDGGLRSSLPTRWKIVPWVWLNQEIQARRLTTAPELRLLISAHAQFQEWIFEGNAMKKMKRIVGSA